MHDTLLIPPHSVQAEQSVLGGLMLANETWEQVADGLVERDFYRGEHRLVFRAVAALAERSIPFDVVTLSEQLGKRGQLEDAGGLAYLATMAKDTPSAANIRAYAAIVREDSIKRDLLAAGMAIGSAVHAPDGRDAAALLDEAERRVLEIADRRGRGGHSMLKGLLVKAVDRIETLYQSGSGMTGLSTGFRDLDQETSGLQAGDLVIVAGRPSAGKTSLAMNIAEHVALNGTGVAVFSLEMPGDQLALRMMSSIGRLDQTRVRSGQLEDDEWPRLTQAVSALAEAPMAIDDTGGLSPTELRARVRRIRKELAVNGTPLGLVVVDYLQLMSAPDQGDNRTNEISYISRSLKALAKELRVPVIALSQLNRSLEQRQNKRPVMSDLRDSGAIEQDADVVLFVYRDEVYNPESPDKGSAEIIIGKQRNGPIGMVRLAFRGRYTRFENFAADHAAGGYA